MKNGKKRLLAIDGGGVRGLIPLRVLAHLEQITQEPVHRLFDVVCGTSAGAIAACALTRPGAQLGDAVAFAEAFKTYCPTIFQKRWRDRLGAVPRWLCRLLDLPQGFDLNDIWRPRYEPSGRRLALEGFLGSARLVDAMLPLYLVSYDITLRCPVIFVSRGEDELDDPYFESTTAASMVDAAMASSAAPTYFQPHVTGRALGGSYVVIDGSVVANNPAQLGHAFFGGGNTDLVLSLGTGSLQQRYSYYEAADWGVISWAPPLLKMMIDGQTEATHIAMRTSMPGSYLRVQVLLEDTGVSDDLDDHHPENLDAIEELAETVIARHRSELEVFAARLLR